MVVVKLPLWKAYLYSLMERIRVFYAININNYNFKFSVKEKLLLKHMFKKYMQKGGQYRYIRSIRYSKLIDSVKSQMVIAIPEELAIVNRLSIVKKINVEDLMNFEIKALKEFAKEVGINAIASSKMKPEELAKEIIKAVDPKKGYSTEFVKWYESVPDSFINSIEVTGAPESEEKSATDNSELIEAINSCTKMGELKELIADESVASSFAGFDISKFKLAGLCKKAMIEFLENPPTASSETNKAEIALAVVEAKDDDSLIAIIEANNELFTDFDLPEDVEDLNQIKDLVIAHLGVELETKKETKPMTLKEKLAAKKAAAEAATKKDEPAPDKMVIDFDPNKFNAEEVYEAADKLQIGSLKKFYSQLSKITNAEMAPNKPGVSKDVLMDSIANALTDIQANGPKSAECECPPATATAESEVTKKMIEDAAKADDKDALAAMCEAMGIQLNPLEKRNTNRMKDKLIAKLPATAEPPKVEKKSGLALLKSASKAAAPKEEPPAAEITETSKLVEIFSIVEKMVIEEADEKDIVAAVTPLYKEMGTSALKIKSRTKTLIEVVQVNHDIKK